MSQAIPSANEPFRNKTSAAIISASDLSETVQQLLREVVRRTRLWKREKAEVALELVSHFRDGVEAGRSIEQMLARFGNPKTAAKLIRRAKKRNRALWWQAWIWCLRGSCLFATLYLSAAGLLCLRHPQVTTDYVARLNQSALATPEADRAWPIYRDAWAQARGSKWNRDALRLKQEDGQFGRLLTPADEQWPRAVQFLREHQALIDAARAGAAKSRLGFIYMRAGISPEDQLALSGKIAPEKAIPADRVNRLMQGSFIHILLPYLDPMREIASLLAEDMLWAASEGDAQRVLADYRALASMAMQCREMSALVNQLVGSGILSLANQTLMRINQTAPESIAACRVELLHIMAATVPEFRLDWSEERTLFLDLIQRVYSDDGHGDGTLTPEGLRIIASLRQANDLQAKGEQSRVPGDFAATLLAPATIALAPSRRQAVEQTEMLYTSISEDAQRPLWSKLREPGKTAKLILQWKEGLGSQFHLLGTVSMPLDKAYVSIDLARALHEATMIALSLEIYRDKTGQYPDSLGALVPHYMPEVPLDHSTGQPLRYTLKDGHPLLYGLGKDSIDDAGAWTDQETQWPNIPTSGDWVLYPPVEE